MLFGEKFCRIKLLFEILSLLFSLPKKSFIILPLKCLNRMKYVMQQNTSLNTTRNILNTFTADKKSIMLPLNTRPKPYPCHHQIEQNQENVESNAVAQTVDTERSISRTVGQFCKFRYSFLYVKGGESCSGFICNVL